MLRRQMSEWRLETLSEKVGEIEQALQVIRADKLKLRDEQQNTARHLSDLDVQIQHASAGSEQRMQLEAVRTVLSGGDGDRGRSALDGIERREAELSRELSAARTRAAEIQRRIGELSAGQH